MKGHGRISPSGTKPSGIGSGSRAPSDEVERLKEALRACIPWIGGSGRGAAQEALAVACELVGYDPFDWTSHPVVLKSRRDLLGLPDRRAE